ncbi:MAG: DEAD/DEAH box helicase [Atopobiaceae bacterium]|nr:DEAD/DEAH box helicase [Atopobiaceae bacterium]
MREQQTRELMEQLDIRVLEPCGMVHSVLHRAGYRNVAQIYNDCVSNTGTLNRLRGAKATRAAVLEIHESVFQDVPTILGLEQNSDTEDKLLSQIYLCKRFPTLRKRRQTLLDVCANTHEACKTLSDLPGFFGNIFMGKDRRKKIDEAMSLLSVVTEKVSNRIDALMHDLEELYANAVAQAREEYAANHTPFEQAIQSFGNSPSYKDLPVVCAAEAKRAYKLTQRFDEANNAINGVDIPSERSTRSEAKKLIGAERELDALRALEQISVDVLAHGGVRAGALKTAGYTNLKQIKNVAYWKLSSITGITSQTASNIGVTVEDIYKSALESSSCRIDIETQSMQQTDLLRQLWYLRKYPDVRTEQATLKLLSSNTLRKLSETTSKPGYTNNLVMHEARKRQFKSEIDILEDVVPKLESRSRQLVRDFGSIRGISTADLWKDFQANAARYYSLIDDLGGKSVDATTGSLPKTLVQQISRTRLNTSLMRSTLRGYQTFGVKYILHQKRTLIGDEMGLGKTVEALAAMAHLATKGETHFVVVCPLSVLVNWTREIPIHTKLTATGIHGPKRNQSFSQWCSHGGVAVTTYGTVAKLDWGELRGTRIGLLVVDEAHYIKNPKAQRTKAIVDLPMPISRRAVFMSGTPLENKVEEMNELISHLNPVLAVQLREQGTVGNPIAYRQEIAPVYLRRHRSDVLDELPKLVEKEDWCTLSPADRKDYIDALRSRNFSSMRRVGWRHSSISRSAKAERLKEICAEAKANGAKVLVFSFFLDTIGKVAQLLGKDCIGTLSGRIPAKKRQELIDSFTTSDKTVLVSQVLAGGVGLNIQAASIIVFCEPQIKPSIEDQAISRAYRMGQVRTVVVHRLLMDDTVDNRIQDILARKRWEFENYADISNAGQESLDAVDTGAILQIIEDERKRYGITGGSETASTRSNATDKS